MPEPTSYDVHIDRPLTSVSIAYIQEQDHFIATKVFPVLPVDKRSDKYFTYTQADWFRDEARPRAGGTESAGGGFNISNDSYLCNVFGFHKDLDDQTVANADAPINLQADSARFVTQKLMLVQETTWVTDFFTTSKWATDKTGATDFTQWNNYATSDPIEDIELGKETILNNTGFMPNVLVLGYQTFRKLKHHPDIVDRMKYTTPVVNSTVDTILLASLFGVEKVLVARAIKNAAVQNATDSYSFIQGKHALLAYVAPRPGLLQATAGYTFMWTGVSKGLGETIGIKKFRMEELESERIEGQIAWDNKLIGTYLGYFYSGATA